MLQESKPTHEIRVERNVAIPMRDGTILRADIYLPLAIGKYPALIERIPYELEQRCKANGEFYAQHGYVFIGQNVRGTFSSKGRFHENLYEANIEGEDGFDTVEWVAEQSWSNGKVGMLGGSYAGFIQYLTGPTRPPHLKALCVLQGQSSRYACSFRGGANTLLIHRLWAAIVMMPILEHEAKISKSEEAFNDAKTLRSTIEAITTIIKAFPQKIRDTDLIFGHLPLNKFPPLENVASWYINELNHPEYGPFWWSSDSSLEPESVDVPIIHMSGWFDPFLSCALRAFQDIQARGYSTQCRESQRLIIGPYIHRLSNYGKQQTGEINFGPAANFDVKSYELHWFDYWLKNVNNEIVTQPPVQIFLMGDNCWLGLKTWPPDGLTYTAAYFHSGNSEDGISLNNGHLSFSAPHKLDLSDSFIYDPAHPVTSLSTHSGVAPQDYQFIESKTLTYTSEILESDLAVIGPVKTILFAQSSAPDTDWVIRLCDVWPDGRSMLICDGILRARYRNSLDTPEVMAPHQVYKFIIDMWATAYVFKAGHRLRVGVTSSDFPRYDRNLNTGNIVADDVIAQVAINTVHHNVNFASHILLPIASKAQYRDWIVSHPNHKAITLDIKS